MYLFFAAKIELLQFVYNPLKLSLGATQPGLSPILSESQETEFLAMGCMDFYDCALVPVQNYEREQWLSGRASVSGARGPGFEHQDHCVVSLTKVLVNTQEIVASSQHD